MAKFRTQEDETPATGLADSPEDWMKKLLSSEDSGIRMNGNDPIMELVMGFGALLPVFSPKRRYFNRNILKISGL